MAVLSQEDYNALPPNKRNTNSIMAGWVDRGPWTYWDTISFKAGAVVQQQYNPFSVPIGSQNPLTATTTTKTMLQTNMQRQNQFPPPRCLLLMAIGFFFSPNFPLSEITKILQSCYVQFKIDDKVFHEGLLWFFPSGGGLTGVSTQNAESTYVMGVPSPDKQRRYGDWSKYIAPLQQFSMVLNFGGGGIAIPTIGTGDGSSDLAYNMIVTLDGLTDRSVQ